VPGWLPQASGSDHPQESARGGVSIPSYLKVNLFETPETVCRKVEALEAAGVIHLCGLYFVGNYLDEMLDPGT
jgi:hypothetical protein